MSTVLRKIRSTVHARAHAETASAPAADQNNFVNNSLVTDNGRPPPVPPKDTNNSSVNLFHHFSSIRHHRKSRIDLSTAVESESSIQARARQLEKQSSITQLRRRLVRKASTFNLHSRRLGGISAAAAQDASFRRSAYLFPDTDTDTDSDISSSRTQKRLPRTPESVRPETASTAYSDAAETIVNCQEFVNTQDRSSVSAKATVLSQVEIVLEGGRQSDTEDPAFASAQLSSVTEKHFQPQGHIWVKMATTTPPLPYETLKKITVEACEIALSNVTAYDHPKTESWNTTIINTILAQLVGETSGSSESSTSAPKYKFVVNSTIVQHRNSMSEHGGGRRGMHSAAGAYWNNEKDGMWSFKYDAGDSKGLDVVVGIVWVWVG